MAQNDMEVIIYKILRYLYDAMKAGKQPMAEDICHNGKIIASIPYSYWCQIIMEMRDAGLIAGVRTTPTKDMMIVEFSDARITLKGAQYLTENSGMQKAKEFAGKTFETILSLAIQALPAVVQNL